MERAGQEAVKEQVGLPVFEAGEEHHLPVGGVLPRGDFLHIDQQFLAPAFLLQVVGLEEAVALGFEGEAEDFAGGVPCDERETEVGVIFGFAVFAEDAVWGLPLGPLQPHAHLPGLVGDVCVFLAVGGEAETGVVALGVGLAENLLPGGHLLAHVGVEHYHVILVPLCR